MTPEQAASERLRLAKDALLQDGYFQPGQVGDDIAPRIIERLSAIRGHMQELINMWERTAAYDQGRDARAVIYRSCAADLRCLLKSSRG